LFILELAGDHSAQFERNRVSVKGIDVDLRDADAFGTQNVVLALEKQADRDLFEGLCNTLITALPSASDAAGALAVTITHIKRWKAFFAGGGQRLSPEEVRGLFAELTFLRALLTEMKSEREAVDAWLGPDRAQHDFVFRNVSVEVKSLSGAERNTVRISSEDQLESLNDVLFLRIYRLSNLPDSAGAISLNDIVSELQGKLSGTDAAETFERKLVSYRYAPMPDYNEPLFIVSEARTYRVSEGFPRLIRSLLPSGVRSVSYEIELESIASFQLDNDLVFRGANGSNGQ
jgi:hypothetical protein